MPTIRFNKPALNEVFYASSYSAGLIHGGANDFSSPPMYLAAPEAGRCVLIIYKGTPETFPSWTTRTTRDSDILISFSLPVRASTYIDYQNEVSTHWRVLVGRHLTNQVATASGIATWFLHQWNSTNLNNCTAVIGSVGLPGTGADLEIPSTSIVAGQNYRCSGYYMNFPLDHTF